MSTSLYISLFDTVGRGACDLAMVRCAQVTLAELRQYTCRHRGWHTVELLKLDRVLSPLRSCGLCLSRPVGACLDINAIQNVFDTLSINSLIFAHLRAFFPLQSTTLEPQQPNFFCP